MPTTAARTLDVSATGEAGIDWDNVGSPTATVGLTNTTVGVVTLLNGLDANVITATSIATDAITSSKVADGFLTAAKFASGAFDAVWTVTVRELTAFSSSFKTGYALSAAGIQAIWDALTAALTTAGSIGKLLVDNINATISSRATQTSVDDIYTDTQDIVTNGVFISTGGISAGSFAAGAIDAAALAASAGQEIADEILNRDIAGGGSGDSRNVRNALRAIRNKVDGSTGTLTVYEEDDTTPAWTAALTRSAVNNVVTVDP
jgi:hypothetical protein